MPDASPSQRHERAELAARMRAEGLTWAEIATVLRARYGVNARVAPRLARGWSQREVADRWTARWPDDPMTRKPSNTFPTGSSGPLRPDTSRACVSCPTSLACMSAQSLTFSPTSATTGRPERGGLTRKPGRPGM